MKLPELETARLIEDLPERLRSLVNGSGKAAQFLWRLFADVFLYAAEKIPEIAERPLQIDQAMRWGYGHRLGPFEVWDASRIHRSLRPDDERRASPATCRGVHAAA